MASSHVPTVPARAIAGQILGVDQRLDAIGLALVVGDGVDLEMAVGYRRVEIMQAALQRQDK